MAIKRVEITNFKSFKDLKMDLGKFNVLIGANASGKSNYIQVFKFLRDITGYGLDNAISMQGGIEYLRNTIIGSSSDFSLRIVSDEEFTFPLRQIGRRGEERTIRGRTDEVIYEFAIQFRKRGYGFEVSHDSLKLKCQFFELEREKGKTQKKQLGSGEIVVYAIDRNVEYKFKLPKEVTVKGVDMIIPFWAESRLPPRTLLIEKPLILFMMLEDIFTDIAIYDFDPKLSKKPSRVIGKIELEEDGSNLAIILNNIRRDPTKRRAFSNLIRDLLPFVNDWHVKAFAADKSMLFTLRETYSPEIDIPASLMSDGTINITALIAALYFQEKSLIIIEEPERNIHPFLISKVVDMLKEASKKQQIITTTHNPEIVKHADLDSILLISRDKEGFSFIARPGEKEQVRIFLENEMGIEELYVQNLLEV